jgi:hypothetical protein
MCRRSGRGSIGVKGYGFICRHAWRDICSESCCVMCITSTGCNMQQVALGHVDVLDPARTRARSSQLAARGSETVKCKGFYSVTDVIIGLHATEVS